MNLTSDGIFEIRCNLRIMCIQFELEVSPETEIHWIEIGVPFLPRKREVRGDNCVTKLLRSVPKKIPHLEERHFAPTRRQIEHFNVTNLELHN